MRIPSRHTVLTGAACGLLVAATVQIVDLTGADAVPNSNTATISPSSVAVGSAANYAFTLTNTTPDSQATAPLTIGSAQITSPAGWGTPTITSVPSGWTATVSGTTICLSSSGSGLTSGQSVIFRFNDTTQAVAGAGTFVTQADIGPSCLTNVGTVPFDGNQPAVNADTLVFTQQTLAGIVSKALTPGFTVTAHKSDGSTDVGFSRPVTLAINANPGGETSFTSATQSASAGSSSFGGVIINKVASQYTLKASSEGSPATSTQSIYIAPAANAVVCPPNQSCDTGLIKSATKSPTSAEAIGDSGPLTDVVSIAVGDTAGISCTGMPTNPAPLDVFVADFNRHLTLKLVYDRDQDKDPVSEFTVPMAQTSWTPVCFQGSNNPTPILLPPCTTTDANGFPAPEPCIAAEYTNSHGSPERLAVLSLSPDPDPHVFG